MESTLDANIVTLVVYREGSRVEHANATISPVTDDMLGWDKLPADIETVHVDGLRSYIVGEKLEELLAYIVGDKFEELLARVEEHETQKSKQAGSATSGSEAPAAYPVRYRAKRGIRSQTLPTVEEIRQKLEATPLLNIEGRPIAAESLHAFFTAYRDTPNQSGRWQNSEAIRTVDGDDAYWLYRKLPIALELFGLGQRYVVFTRNLFMEAYRLSMHGLTDGQISEAIGIDAPKVTSRLRRLRGQAHNPWFDEEFRGYFGMTPSEYGKAIAHSR